MRRRSARHPVRLGKQVGHILGLSIPVEDALRRVVAGSGDLPDVCVDLLGHLISCRLAGANGPDRLVGQTGFSTEAAGKFSKPSRLGADDFQGLPASRSSGSRLYNR